MTTTNNYGLSLPGGNDLYDIESHNENMRKIDEAFSGVMFRFLTEAEYNGLAIKDEKTVYFVTNSSGLKMYLGTSELTGGAGYGEPSYTTVMLRTENEIIGKVETLED